MAKFDCPNCGESVSTLDRVDEKITPCRYCWGRVPIPDSLENDQHNLPATLPVPPPLPSSKSQSNCPASLSESFQSGELVAVTGVGAAVIVAIAIWAWGGWSSLFQTVLWVAVAASGVTCFGFSVQLSEFRKSDQRDSDAYDRCLGTVIVSGGIAAVALLVGGFVYQGMFLVVGGLLIAGLALCRLARSDADFRHLAPLVLGGLIAWKTGVLSTVHGWLYPQPEEIRIFEQSRREVAAAQVQAEVLVLAPDASIQQISDAYRPHFYLVLNGYVEHQQVLFGENAESRFSWGSGVMIANDRTTGLIVTNRHVVEPAYGSTANDGTRYSDLEILVRSRSSKEIETVSVVASHKQLDIALLLVKRPFATARALTVVSASTTQLGQPVVALGNPDREYRVRDGKISSEIAGNVIEHSCLIEPGFSGGPLLSRRGGELVGINTYIKGRAGHYAILVDGVVSSLTVTGNTAPNLLGNDGSDWAWHYSEKYSASEAKRVVRRLAGLVKVNGDRGGVH